MTSIGEFFATTPLPSFSEIHKAPFSNKGFVVVRKGGGKSKVFSHEATLGDLFGNKELPPRDPSKPPIVYLMP